MILVEKKGPTWTMFVMTFGTIERGNLRILKRANETKAFWASRTLSGDDSTYTANVESDTCVWLDKITPLC